MATQRAYLDYYGSNEIIPVRQDTGNLPLHIARRRSLYRHLGLQPFAFRGRRIIEFGPGTGDNALFIASCLPESYVLVDGNPASICAIEDKLERGLLPRDRVKCCQSEILNYPKDACFDVVLCEGVVAGQPETEKFLSHVASFAAPEGILVITTMSATGLLAELCRRVLKPVFGARFPGHVQLVEELAVFFGPDLRSLPGMSRLHVDWVLDQILHPWPKQITFTIPEAITTLGSEFDVLGTSPSFIQDWRWYKSIPLHSQSWNDVAIEEYNLWAGYLLDYRIDPGSKGLVSPLDLEPACQAALQIQNRIWSGDAVSMIPEFITALKEIHDRIASTMPETATSITDFCAGLSDLLAGNREANFGSFRPWFGRSQQYISFSRKS
jgi:ubiquinone/menaquinone biosynthesis C-methylase UbiE